VKFVVLVFPVSAQSGPSSLQERQSVHRGQLLKDDRLHIDGLISRLLQSPRCEVVVDERTLACPFSRFRANFLLKQTFTREMYGECDGFALIVAAVND
jgi:hypothetical protein